MSRRLSHPVADEDEAISSAVSPPSRTIPSFTPSFAPFTLSSIPPPSTNHPDTKILRRASASAAQGGDYPVRVDWARSTGGATFVPLGYSGGRQYEREPEMKYKDDSKSSYVELHMDDPPAGGHRPIDLSAFKMTRNRRKGERIIILCLGFVVLMLLIVGGKSHTSRLLEKTKVAVKTRKNPLKSSIPLHSFRANLKEKNGYVTSFPYGGLTNQLIELFKLVHLGDRLDRTALLTELKAVHSEGGDVPLSTFFDLKSFAYYSNVSMVEWRDVKIPDIAGTQSEILSCWGWRDESPLERYNVKTWFWPPPGQLTVPSSIETSMTFPAIEVLSSQSNQVWLEETATRYFGSVENAPPMPDKQLLCFENLFYVPSTRFVAGEVDTSYAIEEMSPQDPVWSEVGVHLRFNSHINHIADELLVALLGSRTKPFVAVHLRQGDFVDLGRIGHEVVENYSKAEKKVQDELNERKRRSGGGLGGFGASRKKGGGKRLPVLFATDSDDPVFIRKLTSLGWIYINHVEFATAARFGGWYPGILDSVLLSRSKGFVGTKQSTFSYVAARRVEAWNDGVTTIVG